MRDGTHCSKAASIPALHCAETSGEHQLFTHSGLILNGLPIRNDQINPYSVKKNKKKRTKEDRMLLQRFWVWPLDGMRVERGNEV